MPEFEDSILGDDILGELPRPGSSLNSSRQDLTQAYQAASQAVRAARMSDAIVTPEQTERVTTTAQSSQPRPNPLTSPSLTQGAGAKVMSDGRVNPNRVVAQGENFAVSIGMRDAKIQAKGPDGLNKFAPSSDASVRRRFARPASPQPPVQTTTSQQTAPQADVFESSPDLGAPDISVPTPNVVGVQAPTQPDSIPVEEVYEPSDNINDAAADMLQGEGSVAPRAVQREAVIQTPQQPQSSAGDEPKQIFELDSAPQLTDAGEDDENLPDVSRTDSQGADGGETEASEAGDEQQAGEEQDDSTSKKEDAPDKPEDIGDNTLQQPREAMDKQAANKEASPKFDRPREYPEELANTGIGSGDAPGKYADNLADSKLPEINRLPSGGLSETAASSNLNSAKQLSKAGGKELGKQAGQKVANEAGKKVASEAGKKVATEATKKVAQKAVAKKVEEEVVRRGLLYLLGPELLAAILTIVAFVIIFLVIGAIFLFLVIMVAAEIQRLSESSTIEVLRTLSQILFVVPNALITVIIDIIR